MSTDIHVNVEERVNGHWRYSSDGAALFPNDRNYLLFNLLAGVRDEDLSVIISSPRGMPPGATMYVKDKYNLEAADAHSLSYLYLDEILYSPAWDQKKKVTYYLPVTWYELGIVTCQDEDALSEYLHKKYRELSDMEYLDYMAFEEKTKFDYFAIDTKIKTFLQEEYKQIELTMAHLEPNHSRVIFWFDN